MKRDVLEPADDREIVARQEGMKVLEQKNRRLDLLDHQVQGSARIFGGGVAAFLRLDGSADGHEAGSAGPLENFFLPLAGDLDQQALDAQFLAGYDVKDGVS